MGIGRWKHGYDGAVSHIIEELFPSSRPRKQRGNCVINVEAGAQVLFVSSILYCKALSIRLYQQSQSVGQDTKSRDEIYSRSQFI